MDTDPIDLYKVLKDKLETCPADLGGGSYLLQSVLDEYIREPHIKTCCLEEGVPEDLIVTIGTSARNIFAILLLANGVQIIDNILRCGLRDEHLPISLGQSKDHLISCQGEIFRPLTGRWPRPFSRNIDEFLEKQWSVEIPTLDDSGEHRKLDAKCTLPFLSEYQPLGTAARQVFDCTIHPGHFRTVETKQPLQNGGDGVTEWQTHGRRVAVKKFTKWADFEQEMKALRATRNKSHPRLIRYLSTCEKSNTYYILLPWADGSTLNMFWEKNGPGVRPRNQELIRKSLDQLLHLTDALQFLHSLKFRHGDLKPDNILHFTDLSGQVDNFVIADLGVSKHHHKDTGMRTVATLTKSTTEAYEAPEVFTDAARGLPRPRKYDVWSMGCIILEYMVWLLWDSEAVDAFAAARDYPSFAFYQHVPNKARAKVAVVHPEVVAAMGIIREDPRCAERTALRDLVDLVERDLLVVDMDQRIEAAQLHAAVQVIVSKASATEAEVGDAYVLPAGATAPATRPALFQRREGRSGAEPPRTRQSSIAISRVRSWSIPTSSTISSSTPHSFSLSRNGSVESITMASRSKTYHGSITATSHRSSVDSAPLAKNAIMPKKASTWTVLMRSKNSYIKTKSRDDGSITAKLREHYASKREAALVKLQVWWERWTLSTTELLLTSRGVG